MPLQAPTKELSPAEIKKYYEEIGVDSQLPDGSYIGKVMEKKGSHPAARRNKNELPELFFIIKVTEGPRVGATEMVTCRWFSAPNDQDGKPKDEKRLEQANGFLRRQTRDVLRAFYGNTKATDALIATNLPPPVSPDDVYEVFKTVADDIVGQTVKFTRTTKEAKDGTERTNVTFSKADDSGFPA